MKVNITPSLEGGNRLFMQPQGDGDRATLERLAQSYVCGFGRNPKTNEVEHVELYLDPKGKAAR